MQGFNHVAGGIAFTGIFASFTDVNIFERPEYLSVTVFCSLLPDADHTRSIIGKLFYPLAKFINNKFGHRTITHSFIFLLAIWLSVRFLELLYFKSSVYSTIVVFSILSHDIFDMCTKQGILFFYPFSKRPTVLPANPKLRVETNDFRSEAIIFIGFCCLIIFCMPLFANGFWQTYRKAFISYIQVQREVLKSKDLIEINFVNKLNDTTKATIISLNDNILILKKGNDFIKIENPKELNFIDYRHTKQPFKTQNLQLFNISKDSLKYYLNLNILKGQIQCNLEMNWFEGAILKAGKTIDFEYRKDFDFTIIQVDKTSKIAELEIEKAKRLEEIKEFEKIQNQLDKLHKEKYLTEKNYKNLSDYEKGKAQKMLEECKTEIEKLEKIEMPFLLDYDKKIEGLEKEIKQNEVKLNANLLIWLEK